MVYIIFCILVPYLLLYILLLYGLVSFCDLVLFCLCTSSGLDIVQFMSVLNLYI